MFEADLPFDHKTMHLKLEDKNFAGLMEGHQNEFKPEASQEELVEKSLDNPYGSPKLEELCRGKRDIVIISSDHTRPVPSRVTMPILLRRIHAAGVHVIASSHDFQKTPEQAVLTERLLAMQRCGADIAKLAVMPQSAADVLTLLAATEEVHRLHPELPLVTMSMGELGILSRISGELFGSCMSFAAAGESSAPGHQFAGVAFICGLMCVVMLLSVLHEDGRPSVS